MEQNNLMRNAQGFEQLVKDIFQFNNFGVDDFSKEKRLYGREHYCPDFFMKKGRTKYLVEVKYSRNVNYSYEWLCLAKANLELYCRGYSNDYKPVIVVSALVEKKHVTYFQQRGIYVIDITNLLFMVLDNQELQDRLIGALDFSVQNILPKAPAFLRLSAKDDLCLKSVGVSNVYEDKINELVAIGKSFSAYEKICHEILTLLFKDCLKDCGKQRVSNDGLYRFDAIYKIKSNSNIDFFETLSHFFNTQYIIFEFKNYSDKIKQEQIYTTEKYLYTKALRSVAIIISRKGPDDNAVKAAKGALRENGKLIINLSDKNLIEMLNMKAQGSEPADYLSDILDNLLITLEK